MTKLLQKIVFAACGLVAATAVSDPLDKEWNDYEKAMKDELPRTATNILAAIEVKAAKLKMWPDLAAATLNRARLEYGFTEENALDAEKTTGFVAQYAKRLESSPAEVRPMLRLALAHDFLSMRDSRRWWKSRRTKLADASAEPPWGTEKIVATISNLFDAVGNDAEMLKSQKVESWTRLLTDADEYARSCRPTLWDFAVNDAVTFIGISEDSDSVLEKKTLGWLGGLAEMHSSPDEVNARCHALYCRLLIEGGDKLAFAEEWFDRSAVSAEAARAAAAEMIGNDSYGYYDFNYGYGAYHPSFRTPFARKRAKIKEDRVRAKQIAEKFAKRWPDSPGGQFCGALAKYIAAPWFSISSENQLLENGETFAVEYRNVTNIYFKAVPVDFGKLAESDQLFDYMYYFGRGDDPRQEYLSAKAVAEWNITVKEHGDYAVHETVAEVPVLPKGYYLVFAASNKMFGKDGLPVFSRVVSRTDLYLVEAVNEAGFYGFVCDAESGRPLDGVTVEFWKWERDGKGSKVVKTKTQTAADGSWKIAAGNGKWTDRNGFVRAVRDGQGTMPVKTDTYYGHSRTGAADSIVRMVTDRSIYRPGQTVKFKGYLLSVDRNAQIFKVLPGQPLTVSFVDANGKDIASQKLVSSDFGSFSGEFAIPRDRLNGMFSLHIKYGGSVEYAFVRVEEYRRPKFTAEFVKTEGMRLGSETKLTGVAKTYSGLPVAGAKVHWEVTRRKTYPYWCWWIDFSSVDDTAPVAEGDAVTDERGEFICAFTPEADAEGDDSGVDPTYVFNCKADVTDDSGEMHFANKDFRLGKVLWEASLSSPADTWRNARDGVRYLVTLAKLDGSPVPSAGGKLKVYSLVQPEKPRRKRLNYPYWRSGKSAKDYETDPKTWPKGDIVRELEVVTDDKGRAEGKLDLPAGPYIFVYETKSPEGEVRAEEFVRVIDTAGRKHSVMETDFVFLEKSEVHLGETARLYFGTGYDSVFCRVRVRRGDEVLADEMRTGSCWVFEFPVGERHCGTLQIETFFVKDNRFYRNVGVVTVPWDRHVLRVHREHINSKLLPDAKEIWKLKVTGIDTNDFRGGVEAAAFMFDKSLDAFAWYSPSLDFSTFFNPSGEWINWRNANIDSEFSHWRGGWPRPPLPYRIKWAEWRSGALSILDTVTGGWRGGHRRYAPGGAMMLSAPAGAVMENAMPAAACAQKQEVGGAFDSEVAEEMLACDGVDMDGESKAGVKAKKSRAGNADMKPGSDGGQDGPEVSVRKNLQETAFFIPSIVSDANGVFEFSFTVPQALTGWKFCLLAHDKTLASGRFCDETIVTVKPLMTEPNAPRFVREGDDFLFPVKVSNTGDKPEKGIVTLEFEDAETGVAKTLCPDAGGGVKSDFELKPGESKTFEFHVKIPDGCGYLKYTAKAVGAEYADGEEGYLPVLSKRILVRESMPMQIRKAGEKKFSFAKLADSGKSDTLCQVGLAAQVVSDPTWYAFLALPYLMEYPHECNEQIFSRYYANAVGAKIAKSDPEYRKMFDAWEKAGANALKSPLELNDDLKSIMLDATPWVNDAADETKAKRHIGELFGSARLETEQKSAINRLVQNVDANGTDLWPWFPGGRGSTWVTMHILTGAARLKTLGIDIAKENGDFAGVAISARRALDDIMAEDIEMRRKIAPFHISSMDLRWLYLQSFDRTWNKKYSEFLFSHLIAEWGDFSIAGQALGALALHRHGDKEVALKIVKSLKERAVRSDEFGLYWKRNQFFDCSLYAAPVCDQAVAMEAFLEIEPDDIAAYDDARLWLLEQKRTQNWSTTVSTVDAVYAILLGRGKGAPAKVGPVTMKLGGKEVPRENEEAGTGFYEYRYVADEVKPEMGDIVISRGEDALGWASVSWTYLEDVSKVEAYEEKCLRVTKTYFKKTRVDGKVRLVELGGGEKLLPGDELVSRMAIDSDRILEYVHLKDERPASAEPVDVISHYRWQDGLGYYQSTKDTATHYYFDILPKGNFVIETSYRVRQKGVFTSGLATAECMYAPEFGAHSAASVIKVE